MADTYTFDSSLGSVKDRLRLRVGDMNGQPQWFLPDATYSQLALDYTEDEAAARCAETIGAMCAQLSTQVQQRSLRVQYANRSDQMYKLADRIRNLAAPDPGAPPNYGAMTSRTCSPRLHCYEELIGDGHDRGYSGNGPDPWFGV